MRKLGRLMVLMVAVALIGGRGYADQLILGKKLLIKNPPAGTAANKVVHLAKDPAVALSPAGSAGDPQCSGADGGGASSLRVAATGGGGDVTIPLPCGGWTTNGANSLYRYKDPTGATCKLVLVKDGALVKAVCKGSQVGIDVGAGMAPVAVVTKLNTESYCTTFGGTVVKDGGDDKTFLRKDAALPGTCAPLSADVLIQDVQDGTIAAGTMVTIEGVIVTASSEAHDTLWIQEPQGATKVGIAYPHFAGMQVFVGAASLPAVGDCVTVSGEVAEFAGATELVSPTISAASGCGSFPAPESVSFAAAATDLDPGTAGNQAGPLAERFEGVLVTLQNVIATASPDGFGEFPVREVGVSVATISIDDFLFTIVPAPTAGTLFTSISGVYSESFAGYRVLPRDTSDVL